MKVKNADAKIVKKIASQSPYRHDIDGLRGIAVLAVILFHINKNWIPGGFVGVDVFFVISGYLITQHIYQSAVLGTFSYRDFYARRIKRIAPAMLVMVAVTLLAAKFLLLPEDVPGVAKSAIASVVSLVNVYFWHFEDVSYFAQSSAELPLLHLWSLGVEEQFYLVWPILAVVGIRLGWLRFLGGMLLLATASVAIAQWSFTVSPSFTYYMLPSRASELLIGAIAAALVSAPRRHWIAGASLPIAIAGWLLLVLSLVFIREDMVFPGLYSLPPTIGTALLLLSGTKDNALGTQVLKFKPILWVGAVSYSAYLWHWPLLAFFRYGYGEPTALQGVAILVLTLALAWLSYRYVEQGTRHIPLTRWRSIYGSFAGVSAALLAVCVLVQHSDRVLPQLSNASYSSSLAALRALGLNTVDFKYICQRKVLHMSELRNPECILGAGSADPAKVLLLGDSNAAHYVGIVAMFAKQAGFLFKNLEVGSCPALMGRVDPYIDPKRIIDCTHSQRAWKQAIADADVLIFGGSWNEYEAKSNQFLPALMQQVREYTALGKKVILMGKIPEISGFDRSCREKALTFPGKNCGVSTNPLTPEIASVNARLFAFASNTQGVSYFDATSYLCPKNQCSPYGVAGENLYFDRHHLSMKGSWELGRLIVDTEGVPKMFESIKADQQ
jgi:peptidoglycan/LPS O-acetylase OafA/YrhL